MINFDAVDFSERRSEEVISFFWRSVYINIYAAIKRSSRSNDVLIIVASTCNIMGRYCTSSWVLSF